MATFQVPQFIETESKIVGPFSLKQFLYLVVAGVLSYISFQVFSFGLAIILIIFWVSIGLSFALVKINGQPLPNIFLAALGYFLKPRIYTWKRIIPKETTKIESEEEILKMRKNISFQEKLQDLAQKIITGKLSILEKRVQKQAQERYQIVTRITGEKELAKRVDYS